MESRKKRYPNHTKKSYLALKDMIQKEQLPKMHKKEIASIMGFLFLIMAIGLFYFNDDLNITGFAVKKEKIPEFYGTYSIKPSFKVNVDYDFEEYNKIIDDLKKISNCAKDGTPVETCIDELEKTDYGWELNCQEGVEKIFYDFVEFYQDCFNSEDNNCICKLNLDYSEEDIKKYNLIGKYKLKLEQDYDQGIIKLRLEEPETDLEYDIKTNKIGNFNPFEYTIEYKKDKKGEAELMFKEELAGNSYSIMPIDALMLYKFDDRYSNKKQDEIEFFGEDKDGKDKVISFSKEEKNVEDVKKLKECTIKRNIHKFCVTNTKKQFYVFDKIKNKLELKNPVIKFAAYIEDLPPPVVENIEIRDKLIDDKSVIIKWDKSKADDVMAYNIYYAKSALNLFDGNKALSEMKEELKIEKLSTAEIEAIEVDKLVLNNCEFDFDKKGCVYTTGKPEGIILEKGKLYYFKEPLKEYYLYALSVDNEEHDFSVTAIDKNGNEIGNIEENEKLPVIKNKKSEDDLPINSKGIAKLVFYDDKKFSFNYHHKTTFESIDGTEANDFKQHNVYYYVADNLGTIKERKDMEKSVLNKPLSELTYLFDFEPELRTTRLIISPTLDTKKKETFFFVITAMDKNDNPKPRITPKEVGIESLLYYKII